VFEKKEKERERASERVCFYSSEPLCASERVCVCVCEQEVEVKVEGEREEERGEHNCALLMSTVNKDKAGYFHLEECPLSIFFFFQFFFF